MKFIQNLINRLFNSWQTTLIGIMICVLTVMLWKKEINMSEWAVGIGTVLTVWAAMMKDPDKTANKNKDGQP